MAGETDEPHDAAARLEAALERIAAAAVARQASASPADAVAPPSTIESSAPVAPEIASRLDGLIERLRGALAVRAG